MRNVIDPIAEALYRGGYDYLKPRDDLGRPVLSDPFIEDAPSLFAEEERKASRDKKVKAVATYVIIAVAAYFVWKKFKK